MIVETPRLDQPSDKNDPRRACVTGRCFEFQQKWKNFYSSEPYAPSRVPYNVTIGENPRFVWFRVAKVATRSIYSALKSSRAVLSADHPYNCLYSAEMYMDHFKFAFVRHPVDRLLSCWRNKVRDSDYFFKDEFLRNKMMKPDYFVNWLEDQDLRRCDLHLRLQSRGHLE